MADSNDAPNAGSLADMFQNEHPFPAINPLRMIKFDNSIHKRASEHLIHRTMSPFSRDQMGTEMARKFYFKFFIGLLSVARLKPGSEIYSAYVRESGDQLHILALFGKKQSILHLHKISTAQLSSNPPPVYRQPIEDSTLAALARRVHDAEREIDDTVFISGIENHEYELIPRSTNADDRAGVEMILLRNTKVEINPMAQNPPSGSISFADYERQPLLVDIYNSFIKIYKNAVEPTANELEVFLKDALRYTPREHMHEPQQQKMETAGFLHGAVFPALLDDYYQKMMSSEMPHIRYNEHEFSLYFPPVSTMPEQHYLIDTTYLNINIHVGYYLLYEFTHVDPETKVLEIRYIENHLAFGRSDPLTSRTLQMTVENIVENMNHDILEARAPDEPVVAVNVDVYSAMITAISSYKSIKYGIRSIQEFKSFLLGHFGATQDTDLGFSRANGIQSELYLKKTSQSTFSSILTFYTEERQMYRSLENLIQLHRAENTLLLNFRYDNNRIKLQPWLSLSPNQVVLPQQENFQQLPRFDLNSALRITDSTTKDLLHASVDNFFRSIRIQPIEDGTLGAFIAGVIQKMPIRVNTFQAIFTHGTYNIRTETIVNGNRVPLYMQIFRSPFDQSANRALHLRTLLAENNAIIMTYNLYNENDGLALMTVAEGQRHLNTDNVLAMCRDAARKKRTGGICSFGGKEKFTEKIDYEKIEGKTAERFPKLKRHLSAIHEFAGKIQLGFIGRDFIGGIIQKDWESVKHTAYFFGAAVASSKIGTLIAARGVQTAAEGETLLGHTMESIGKCLPKIGFDIYMGYQLYNQMKRNDTESALYTAAFIGIDLIECGLEALEAFGLISFGAILTPFLAVAGTAILVAQSVMETVRRMNEITAVVPLSLDESIYETTRELAFFGTDATIQSMMDEVTANEISVLQTLEKYPKFGRFLISAAVRASENGSIVYMDDNTIDLTRRHNFKKSRLMPRDKILNNKATIFCALDEAHNPGREELELSTDIATGILWGIAPITSLLIHKIYPKKEPYLEPINDFYCENAFGIKSEKKNGSSETLYLLFNGTDRVIGFPDHKNVFFLMNGNKSIVGGCEDDYFSIQADYINGYLNGSDGEDVVDFIASVQRDLVIREGEAFFTPKEIGEQTLKLHEIESIVGRSDLSDYIEICDETKVDLAGAKQRKDQILITNSCGRLTRRNLTIVLRKNTFVLCDVHDLVRYIVTNDSESDLSLSAGHHYFQFDAVELRDFSLEEISGFHVIKVNNMILKILADDVSNITLHFTRENLTAKFDHEGFTGYLHGEHDIFDIIEKYGDFIEENHKIRLIASSKQGTIVLNHNIFTIDREDGTKPLNIISNGHRLNAQLVGHKSVENYFIISLDELVVDYLSINITIHPQISPSFPCYIDLHDLTRKFHEFTTGDYGMRIIPEKAGDNIKLFLMETSNRQLNVEKRIGEINIIDGYKFLDQIEVYLHSTNVFSDHEGTLSLHPIDIDVNRSTISILPGQIEFQTTIYFDQPLNNLRPYRLENTLILTDIVPMVEMADEQPLTISLVDYYAYEAKYNTLSLSSIDDDLDIVALADNAQDMRFLWVDVNNSLDGQEGDGYLKLSDGQ